jgi:hypothetical protein
MATTFTKIADVTVGSGGAASIDFTSIPGTYTDLVIKYSLRSNVSGVNESVGLRFNSDSGANYSYKRLYATGSATGSDSPGSNYSWGGYVAGNTSTANTFGNGETYIPNYAGSTAKSNSADGVGETDATTAYMSLHANLWNSSSAINAITLLPINGTAWNQYSTATLYGVNNA